MDSVQKAYLNGLESNAKITRHQPEAEVQTIWSHHSEGVSPVRGIEKPTGQVGYTPRTRNSQRITPSSSRTPLLFHVCVQNPAKVEKLTKTNQYHHYRHKTVIHDSKKYWLMNKFKNRQIKYGSWVVGGRKWVGFFTIFFYVSSFAQPYPNTKFLREFPGPHLLLTLKATLGSIRKA